MKIKLFALSLSKCLALTVALSACTTPAPVTPVSRYSQAVDMQPCPPLVKPADGSLSSLYRYGVSAAHRYHDCSAHHDNLIDWVKRGEAAPH